MEEKLNQTRGHHHRNGVHKKSSSHRMSRNMLKATLLNILITIVQSIGGLLANSISLLSDALHNFSDALAILVSYFSMRASRKEPNELNTFGQKRIEIIAALFNGLLLSVVCAYLIYEAYNRFINPQPVKGLLVIVIGSVGLLANLWAVLILQKDSKQNINVKSAYLHLLGDTLSSMAVVIGGILMYYTSMFWIDPLITFLISLYILKETFEVIRQAFLILSQAVPEGIQVSKIKERLEIIPGIKNVHHIHVWNLDDQSIHFESHVDLTKDYHLSETVTISQTIRSLLKTEFGIKHTTLQFEYNCCNDKKLVGEPELENTSPIEVSTK